MCHIRPYRKDPFFFVVFDKLSLLILLLITNDFGYFL